MQTSIRPFASALLQYRLEGKLKNERTVQELSEKFRPAQGFTNEEWDCICEFILSLKDVNSVFAARKLISKHNLELRI